MLTRRLFVRIPFLCHLLCCFIFLYFCFFGLIAYQNSSHDVSRLCYHMSTKNKNKNWTRKNMYKKYKANQKVAKNGILTKRLLENQRVRENQKQGTRSCFLTNLNNTLYQCLKSINSYKMVLLLLTTSPYKMSLHTLLTFVMFNNSILSLQKHQKN